MPRIRQLDALVVNKIAAGEVIERPASVVKELLENSLDALATRVEIDVAQGGTELIRVTDDGEGIHPDDLRLSVTSHATSKIGSADDLFRVHTLGFRGEALASIAAVSQLRLRSRTAESEAGVELEVESGRVGESRACGCPQGTQIEIRQLLANTPVRRKFLKTVATEFGHLSEQFIRVTLAHPRLHAVLRHNGKTVHELPSSGDLLSRLRLFFGSELVDELIPVESQVEEIRLWGYVGHPSRSKSNRKGQYLFLNGRWIQDRSLGHALNEAYRGLLMVGRHPVAFLFLEMPPDQVDVNVHPTKSEVRFRDAQQLYRQLLSTLRDRFLSMELDSTMQLPRDQSPATKAPVDAAKQRELQLDVMTWAKGQLSEWKPSASDSQLPPITQGAAATERDIANVPVVTGMSPPVVADSTSSRQPANADRLLALDNQGNPPVAPTATRDMAPEGEPLSSDTTAAPRPGGAVGGDPGPSRIMQVHDCYLVFETDEGLTVIDQHALHERVVYEQLRQRVLSGAVESQRMLAPEPIELSPDEAGRLLEEQDLLAELGFRIEEFGKGTVLLSGYPPMLARSDLVQVVRDIAEQLATVGQKPTRRDILDKLLHVMSCRSAVKAGQRLTQEEMQSLLAQRHLIDDAHHCPHGRPTALVLSRTELDRQFGRLG
jgi:DNA mismatch repair protein MutL